MGPRPYLVPALHASELVADHEWAAVTRVATDCILGANGSGLTYDDGERFTEGRNRGWPGDAGRAAYAFHPSAASHKSRWGYGCWFYLMRGAPAAINVGRSLRAQTRREVHATLGIPCPASDPLCTTPPGDKLYCELASKLGYATIQIAQAHFNARPELIACHGKCMSAAVRGACPPLPLQRADRPGERCKCDRRSAHLGCGSTEPLSCAAARPARAQMWHDACVAGLYRNCTDGSRPRAAPAPAATLAGSRRRARRRRDAGRRLASASPPVVEPAAKAASVAAAAQVAASVAAAAVATHVPPKPRKKLLKRSKSKKHTVITVLGDSLSSPLQARCNVVFPWPMLLQDALGREQFTVHGFALPGVHAQNYADTDVWTRAITTTPDILAIMLGTNDGHDSFRGEKFRGWIQRLLAGFNMPRGRVILIAPPPLWKDHVFTNMRKHVINNLIPPIVGDMAHKIGARFINMKARMLEAGFTSAISCDGCHLYPEGQTFMMQQVLDTVRSMMTPPPSPPPPPPPPPPPTRVEWTRGLLKDVLFGILFGAHIGVLVGISRAGFRAGLLE